MRTDDVPVIRLSDYAAPDFLIEQVDLDVGLDATATVVRARLSIRRNPRGRDFSHLILQGDELDLVSVELDGRVLDGAAFTADPQQLVLPEPPDVPFVLTLETRINPSSNTKLMGLYKSGATYCTQCEPEGFRRITYFLDRPDVMAVYTLRISAEKEEAPVLLGNGNLIDHGDVAGTSLHYAVWHDPFPKPSYLFAMVGGRLDVVRDSFVTMSGRTVELGIYVESGKADRAGYAMDALKRSMRWDETEFGREYDLDVFNIVAVSDFNMGAMENKGLNVFNDKYILASPDTATDSDYAGIESVIAHEYFHNWTGNRITCRDWFQLCLKEGLTVFRDQEFSADQRSRPVKRIADVRTLRAHQFPEDAGPLAHPARPDTYREINNFYTATVYEKGAEIVRMLKTLIGADAFRRGMDLYFARHDGEATTVEAFVACFAESSGRDLSRFMLWYAQAGTPQLDIDIQHDASTSRLTLTITQKIAATPGQPVKSPLPIPLAVGFLGEDGEEQALALEGGEARAQHVLEIDASQTRISFTGAVTRPKVSLNRGFTAPVRIQSNLDEDDYLFLARHDGDLFNRWEAMQRSAMHVLIALTAALRTGREAEVDLRLADALALALDDKDMDDALLAQLLTLPSEIDIAGDIARDIAPDAIHRSLSVFRRSLGRKLRDKALARYDALAEPGAFRPDAASAGRRLLRGALLTLLTAEHDTDAVQLADAHYRGATNMTDRMNGLAALSRIPSEARRNALEDFLDRYSHDALILDKWLSIQASIPEPETLDRVQGLTEHPMFAWTNPNKVRALVGSFAMGNPTQFHRRDGAGYDFVADAILRLDRKNPQVAARLLTAFRSWRTLEPDLKAQAGNTLSRIASTKTLSPDVGDILSRTRHDLGN